MTAPSVSPVTSHFRTARPTRIIGATTIVPIAVSWPQSTSVCVTSCEAAIGSVWESGPESQTLPIAASQLVTQTSIDWGQLTAIGTIVVAPMILVGLIVRKWLVTGLTLGAVTGE